MVSDKLKWAMIQLNNKASGGKNGFELDEIVPTIEQEIKFLESELKKRDELLEEAVKYLYLGKKQFSPNTTNSDVDYFLSKPEIKKILGRK